MKLLCHAFDATLRKFDIKGLQLAADAEVSTGMISNFRNDTSSITTDNLEKLLAAFSDEAFAYWISQVIQGRELEDMLQSPIAIQTFVNQLDAAAAAEVLANLAVRIREGARKSQGQIGIT